MPPHRCRDEKAYTPLLLLFSAGSAERRAYIDLFDEDRGEYSADLGQGRWSARRRRSSQRLARMAPNRVKSIHRDRRRGRFQLSVARGECGLDVMR